MARFRRGLLSAGDASGELDLSRSRFYVLYAGYLRACAERRQRSWRPGHSGGNHHCRWPLEVTALLRKLLNARPALSYSFAASEVHRRHHLKVDRASVRRWALAQALAPDTKYKPPRKPVRRWQVQQIGQLWQYDASPHRWFAERPEQFPLLEKRLPALFAAEQVSALPAANALLDEVRHHHNVHEKHREVGSTPQAAWELARREKRSVLRPAPRCPWWPYVWSQRSATRVEPDGRIAFGGQRLRIDKPPGTKIVRCLHPNGDHSILAAPPTKQSRPVLLLHSPAPAPVLL